MSDTMSGDTTFQPTGIWRFWLTALSFVFIGVVALLPRVLDLGGFITVDEVNFWLPRSERFLDAIQSGNYADTAIKPHPGVTTMWLGSAGILLRRTLLAWGLVQEMPFPLLLALMRLPASLVHVAGILAGYALLLRMLPAHTAMLAALLWATDPFLIGFQRVLHVDGLATTFLAVSLLAACYYWHHQPRVSVLVLSSVCAGLAVLSKVPALALLPVVAVIAGAAAIGNRQGAMQRAFWTLAGWGGVFGLTLVLVWPAVWAEPLRVFQLFIASIEEEGGQPHGWGNYFMGQPVDDPGILFYPVALVLRLTPWTLIGALLLPWAQRHRSLSPAARRDLTVLAGFVVCFIVAMSLFPKKFDRYLLPAFPALDILAAVGLCWMIEQVRLTASIQYITQRGLLVLVALVTMVNAAWWHPYSLLAFNQALGGTRTGVYMFPAGWGEGLGEVADWLNAQPDITGVKVASLAVNSLQPYLRHGAQAVTPYSATLPPDTGYVLVYVRDVQRQRLGAPFDQFYPDGTPLHTVMLYGVSYAWIYQVPPALEHTSDAVFGSNIHLRGYEVDVSAVQNTGVLSLTLQWQARAPVTQDYMLFVHVLDADGQRVGQTDAPPAGTAAPTSSWQVQRVITWTHPIPVQPDLPPGDYWLTVGLYDPETFDRLPFDGAVPAGGPDSGGDALLIPIRRLP